MSGAVKKFAAAIAVSCAVGGGVALAGNHAGAAGTGFRLSGFGQRNTQFLTVDIRIKNGAVSGAVTLGEDDGTVICNYHSFTLVSLPTPPSGAVWDGTGFCEDNNPDNQRTTAAAQFSVNAGGDAGGDFVDVNALPGSGTPEGMSGGFATGNYFMVQTN